MSESISYRLALDNSQYVGGMRAAQAEVRQLSATTRSANLGQLSGELQLASGSMSTFTGRTAEADGAITRLITSFRSGTGALGGISAGFAGAAAPITLFAASLKASQAILETYAGYDGLVRGLKTMDGTAAATTARIEQLRLVAQVPGLGFEEAVRGDIRLRAVGISADLSERSLRAFGNALATVGGGKAELDGVILALGQIAAKGKVSAEEINQIAERVPQVRQAMKDAFGTADTEALGKAGVEAMGFINGLVAELEKLPQVTGGARNDLDNYADSWSALKTQASEFGAEMAGGWLRTVTGAINQARRDLVTLKNAMGMETPGLKGPDGQTEAARIAEQEEAARVAAAEAAEKARVDAANAAAAAMEQREADRAEKERYHARQREESERAALARTAKAREEYYRATDTPEQGIRRRIAALQAEGPSGQAAVDAIGDPSIKAQIYERTLQIRALEKELADMQAAAAEQAKAEAVAAQQKAESEARTVASRRQASAIFALDNAILEARAAGNTQLSKELETQRLIEEKKLQLMRDQGMEQNAALAAATRMVGLQQAADKKSQPKESLRDRLSRERQERKETMKGAADAADPGMADGKGIRKSWSDLQRTARWNQIKEATDAAAKNPVSNKPTPPKNHGEAIERKLEKLDAIHETLSNFAKA